MLNSLFWLCETCNCDIISGRRATHDYPSEKVLCTSLLILDTTSEIGLYEPMYKPSIPHTDGFWPVQALKVYPVMPLFDMYLKCQITATCMCITLMTDVNIKRLKHTCNSYCKKNDEWLQDHFNLWLRMMESLPEYLDLQSTGFIPVFIHGKLAGNRWLANWQIHFLKLTCPE